MAKVLLVEDDNNLREIYQARLTAEGYDIVTAQNGEEALVVAKQNKPDLIVSDVMMPRISGFEMLDILRNTDGIKHTKVIMLTALGQADDQKRAEGLGADRYLVKSQVTLEDIVNAAKTLLSEDGVLPPAAEPAVMPAPAPAATSAPAPNPPAASVTPTIVDTPVQLAPEPGSTTAQSTPASQPAATQDPAPQSPAPAAPQPPTPSAPTAKPPVAPTPPPEPATPDPAPEPENETPSGPTAPATPPSAETVDASAQGLEAEEAALQAKIASYSNSSAPAPEGNDAATTDSTSNDQAIANAVEQLNASAEPPVAPTPAPAASSPEPKAEEPTPEPAAPPTGEKPGDAVTVAGKKIIQPINDTGAKPDLNALLAKEEAKDASGTPPAAPAANGAETQSSPQPPAGGTPGQAFDPNTSL